MDKEGLVDREWIDAWTYGYDELVERCQTMPPSKAAEICGVPEDLIWKAARMYGSARLRRSPGALQSTRTRTAPSSASASSRS